MKALTSPTKFSQNLAEPIDLLRNFGFSLLFTLILLAIKIYPTNSQIIYSWLHFILATLIVILCGLPIFKEGWTSIIKHRFDMYTLVTIAIIATYVYGIFILFFSTLFPPILFINQNVNFLFEIASIVTTLILFEQIVEVYAWKNVKNFLPPIEEIPTHTEKMTSVIMNYFIILVILISILTLAFRFQEQDGFISAIAVLLIACPRPISLIAPLAIQAGIKSGLRYGIQFKNTNALEQLRNINMLVIDKNMITTSNLSLALKLLHDEGMKIAMVTNDKIENTESVTKNLDIDAIETAFSPFQNKELSERLSQQGFTVAIASPQSSDQGEIIEIITDIQNQQASIKLISHDLLDLVRACQLSKIIMKNIRFNLLIAFIYNLLFVPIAAGIFYFWTGLIINPIIATMIMITSTILIMLNTVRLQKIKLAIPTLVD